jgi:glyoxylase-like metal-dependent hydrolase (beta-lactamase superfamily II)
MFELVSVSTPFAVGPVNAYVAGRTVVDPGPASGESWSALLDGLEAEGLAPEDLERVLVTHPHPDHFGLASRLRDAGADVVATPPAAAIMADFPARLQYEQDFFTDFLQRCGLAAETARTVTQLPESFLPYAPSVETDHEVVDGDAVRVDGTELTVDQVAGHSPGEAVFAYEQDGDRWGIVGDHVLAEITPNPHLQPPPDPGAARPRVLPTYNDSLERVAAAGYDRFLPGHRGVVDDPPGRIEAILADHEERTANVLDLVNGPTTPAEVMTELFGDLPATEKFPGMSEAVGHLDVLEERGEVASEDRGGVLVYRRRE